MSRETDRAMVDAYRTVSTDMLGCLFSWTEMLTRLTAVLPPAEHQVVQIGLQDLQAQLFAIGRTLREIEALQAENVRASLHGG